MTKLYKEVSKTSTKVVDTEIKNEVKKTASKAKVARSSKAKGAKAAEAKQEKILNALSVAKWLVFNTGLTFGQIAKAVGMDEIEVNSISDGFVALSTPAIDPVSKGYFSREDITSGEADEDHQLTYLKNTEGLFTITNKKHSYTPIATRYNRISAAMWILQNYPKVPLLKITKLLKVSSSIAHSIKDKTYKNVYNLTAKDPVLLGVCSVEQLNAFSQENEQHKAKAE